MRGPVLRCTLFALTLLMAPPAGAQGFHDDFNGTALDPLRWIVNPGSGTVTVANGKVRLSADCGQQFPYVVAAANPFPTSGDFRVSIGFRYVTPQYGGNGMSVTTPGCNGYSCNPGLRIWQDTCCGGLRYSNGSLSETSFGPAYDTAPHVAEWTVTGNRWEFVLDGTLRSVTTFAQRPNGFWFGHPPYTYCPWTTQELDFITITPFLPTATTRSNWSRVKAIYR